MAHLDLAKRLPGWRRRPKAARAARDPAQHKPGGRSWRRKGIFKNRNGVLRNLAAKNCCPSAFRTRIPSSKRPGAHPPSAAAAEHTPGVILTDLTFRDRVRLPWVEVGVLTTCPQFGIKREGRPGPRSVTWSPQCSSCSGPRARPRAEEIAAARGLAPTAAAREPQARTAGVTYSVAQTCIPFPMIAATDCYSRSRNQHHKQYG